MHSLTQDGDLTLFFRSSCHHFLYLNFFRLSITLCASLTRPAAKETPGAPSAGSSLCLEVYVYDLYNISAESGYNNGTFNLFDL